MPCCWSQSLNSFDLNSPLPSVRIRCILQSDSFSSCAASPLNFREKSLFFFKNRTVFRRVASSVTQAKQVAPPIEVTGIIQRSICSFPSLFVASGSLFRPILRFILPSVQGGQGGSLTVGSFGIPLTLLCSFWRALIFRCPVRECQRIALSSIDEK